MINPAALGVSLLILLAATMTVESSAAKNSSVFKGSQQTLSNLMVNVSLKEAISSYQRHTNTITLDAATLKAAHMLHIEVPLGTDLRGQLVINDDVRLALDDDLRPIDLGPYLSPGLTQVVVTGTYRPPSASVIIRFEGPTTVAQQQTAGVGELNYQLNLIVE